MRYFLIDRIDELKKNEYAIGTKCITLADDCFEQHFPGRPVYPGALLIEAMAQLGGALLELSLGDEDEQLPRCVLSSVKAKFREFARPGDRLSLRADIKSMHDDAGFVHVEGTRDGARICEADIVYIILKIEDAELEASRRSFLKTMTSETVLK